MYWHDYEPINPMLVIGDYDAVWDVTNCVLLTTHHVLVLSKLVVDSLSSEK